MNILRRISNAVTTHPNLAIVAMTIFVIAAIVGGTFIAANDLETRLTDIVFSTSKITSYTTVSNIKDFLENRGLGVSSMAAELSKDRSIEKKKDDIESYYGYAGKRYVEAAILIGPDGTVLFSTDRKYDDVNLMGTDFWNYQTGIAEEISSLNRRRKSVAATDFKPYAGRSDMSSFLLIGAPIIARGAAGMSIYGGAFAILVNQFGIIVPPAENLLGLQDTTLRLAIGLFAKSGYPFMHLWSSVPSWNRQRIHNLQLNGRQSCASCHSQNDIDLILAGTSSTGSGSATGSPRSINSGTFIWNSTALTSKILHLQDSAWYAVVSINKAPVRRIVNSFSSGLLILMGGTVVLLVVILTFGFYAHRRSVLEQQRLLHVEQVSTIREQYETLIEKSNDGIYILFENHIVFANKTFLDMFGYTLDELTTKNFIELVAPESRHIIEDRIERMSRGAKVQSRYGFLAVAKDGKRIPVEVSVTHVPFAGSVRTIGIVRDLSELTAQKQLYVELFKNAPIGLGIYRDFKAVRVNETAAKLLGYKNPDELIGINVMRMVHPDDLELAGERVRRAMEERLPVPPIEERFIRQDGSTLHVLVLSQPVIFEGEDAVQIAFVSLEDRKKLEENLAREATTKEQEKARLDTLLQSLDEGILFQSPEGRVGFANSEFCRIFGFGKPADLIGMSSKELLQLSSQRVRNPEEFVTKVLRDVENKETVRGARLEFAGDMIVERSAMPIFEPGGKYIGRLGIFRDVTQRERNEEAIKRLQRTELLGRLAGGIAHDFNNVLAIIIGSLQMIMRKAGDPAAVEENTQRALSSAFRGAEVAKRLLQFVRYSPEAFQHFSLRQIIDETVSIIKHTFEENISVQTEFILNDAVMHGSPGDLQQVIINLANNSRDAMPNGGVITISLTTADRTRVEKKLGAPLNSNFVLITIQDTGQGIEESRLEKIFDPFFTTKDIGKGTGLGLSIVQTIISAHNGYIEVTSRPNGGTTFFIYLPMSEKNEAALSPENEGRSSHRQFNGRARSTVLVVEDEPALRDLLDDYLSERGFNVLDAADGEEGYRVFRSHPEISAVLSDLGLPKLPGDKLISMIKSERSDVKCILATGYLTPAADGALAELEVRMIMKPYNLQAIYNIISGDSMDDA